MKIAIIGYGFVGKALHSGLRDNVELIIIDPKLNTDVSNLSKYNPDIIFICAPTPMLDDGSQDISIVTKIIKDIDKLNIKSLIVLKSTVLPDKLKAIDKLILKFIYNPEFLREKHANQDFVNSELIVFGGKSENTKILASFYDKYTKCICKKYIHTDITTASFIKYSINSFLALKVTYFNELKSLFDSSNANDSWKNFINFMATDSRIGSSHMDVPGHDGRKGFGGACLPKDSSAFEVYARSKKTPLNLLNKAININNQIRSKYNVTTDREKDQNIKFNGDD